MRDSLASATQSKAQAAYYRAVALRNFSEMFSGITGSAFQKLVSVPLDSLRQWESEQKLAGLVSAEFAEPLAPQNAMAVVSAVFPSQWADLPQVLGGAFARRLFDDLGMDDSLQAYTPFFSVLIGGRGRSSRSEAAAALDALPGWDVLARARMEVVLAELSESNSEAFEHYASAWRLHAPSLVGARIPVRIQDSGGGREVLDLVSGSSSIRVVDTEPAFVLQVGNGSAVFSALGRSGVIEAPLINGAVSAKAAAVVRAIFAAGPLLTEQEMSFLDGRTLSSAKGAAETGK
jgi:hypothetical protein